MAVILVLVGVRHQHGERALRAVAAHAPYVRVVAAAGGHHSRAIDVDSRAPLLVVLSGAGVGRALVLEFGTALLFATCRPGGAVHVPHGNVRCGFIVAGIGREVGRLVLQVRAQLGVGLDVALFFATCGPRGAVFFLSAMRTIALDVLSLLTRATNDPGSSRRRRPRTGIWTACTRVRFVAISQALRVL